jgi:hypothetical protein
LIGGLNEHLLIIGLGIETLHEFGVRRRIGLEGRDPFASDGVPNFSSEGLRLFVPVANQVPVDLEATYFARVETGEQIREFDGVRRVRFRGRTFDRPQSYDKVVRVGPLSNEKI